MRGGDDSNCPALTFSPVLLISSGASPGGLLVVNGLRFSTGPWPVALGRTIRQDRTDLGWRIVGALERVRVAGRLYLDGEDAVDRELISADDGRHHSPRAG